MNKKFIIFSDKTFQYSHLYTHLITEIQWRSGEVNNIDLDSINIHDIASESKDFNNIVILYNKEFSSQPRFINKNVLYVHPCYLGRSGYIPDHQGWEENSYFNLKLPWRSYLTRNQKRSVQSYIDQIGGIEEKNATKDVCLVFDQNSNVEYILSNISKLKTVVQNFYIPEDCPHFKDKINSTYNQPNIVVYKDNWSFVHDYKRVLSDNLFISIRALLGNSSVFSLSPNSLSRSRVFFEAYQNFSIIDNIEYLFIDRDLRDSVIYNLWKHTILWHDKSDVINEHPSIKMFFHRMGNHEKST